MIEPPSVHLILSKEALSTLHRIIIKFFMLTIRLYWNNKKLAPK